MTRGELFKAKYGLSLSGVFWFMTVFILVIVAMIGLALVFADLNHHYFVQAVGFLIVSGALAICLFILGFIARRYDRQPIKRVR